MQDVNLQLFGDSVLAEEAGNTATEQEALAALGRMDLAQYAQAHPLALWRTEAASCHCGRLPQRKKG